MDFTKPGWQEADPGTFHSHNLGVAIQRDPSGEKCVVVAMSIVSPFGGTIGDVMCFMTMEDVEGLKSALNKAVEIIESGADPSTIDPCSGGTGASSDGDAAPGST